MQNYKAPDNSLHVIEPEFAYMLPDGCIAITDEEAEALRPVPPAPTYQELRAAAYPSFADQFDLLYHGGVDAWKAAITAIKEEFPK